MTTQVPGTVKGIPSLTDEDDLLDPGNNANKKRFSVNYSTSCIAMTTVSIDNYFVNYFKS